MESVGTSQLASSSGDGKELESLLLDKGTQISGTLKYLLQNLESLDESQQKFLQNLSSGPAGAADPLHALQRMSLNEMTKAYDNLLAILIQRERLIKTRIKDTITSLEPEERVLFESLDYKNELENLPEIGGKRTYDRQNNNIDRYLSLSE